MSQLQVTGEAKIRDIQGPVVANSGVITALDGAASQYVRGDGTLADFPTSSGGGSSVSYYLNSSVSQGTIGGVAYRELSKEPIIGAGTDIAISSNGYVANYITDVNDPDVVLIPGGNFNCEFYFSVNNNTGNPFFYAELYKYDGTTFTLLGSSVGVPEYITQGTTIAPYYFAIPVATATLALTDRLAIRIYVNVSGRTVTLHTENGHLCQVVTTLSKGMVSLNNLTDQSQFLTTGTSGTNFAIVSSGDTHTFNLPIASASNTGKLSSTDWSTFNNKQAALSFTAPLDNTSNTISIPAASASVDGYLDNLDWTKFNTAYNDSIISAAVTGTTTKTLTLNQQDGGTITASWTDDNTDAVTSVFGRTGAVVAVSGDYNTSQVTENTNLYFTDARARAAISLTTTGTSGAATYNNTTGAFNIPQYQAALTNPVTGTGTTNNLSKFTGASTIGDSGITDNGTTIGIPARNMSITNPANDITFSIANTNAAPNSYTQMRFTGTGRTYQIGIGNSAEVTYGVANKFYLFDGGASAMRIIVDTTGATTISNLAGTGTRMVVADASGVLSTQAISGGTITGSGTTNKLAKFTGSTAIGDSIISADANAATVTSTVVGPMFILDNPSAAWYSQMQFKGDTKDAYIFKGNSTYTSYGGANSLNFYTDPLGGGFSFSPRGTENAVFIDPLGNFGIGVGTTVGAKLDIAGGNARITSSQNGFGGISAINPSTGTSAYGGILLGNNAATTAAGFLILGSNWPTAGAYTGDGAYLFSNRVGGLTIATENVDSTIKFITGTTIKATMVGNGNLGLNETAPTNLLHLAGNVATPSLRLASTSTGFYWDIGRENATTGDFVFNYKTPATSSTEWVRITTLGLFGIGVTPSGTYGKLTVAGGIRTTADSLSKLEIGRYNAGNPDSYIKLGSTSNGLIISNAADSLDLFYFKNSGRLGIGITPTAVLDVQGSVGGALSYMRNNETVGYTGIDFFRQNGAHAGSVWCANDTAGATNNRNALTLAARTAGEKVIIVGGGYDPTVTGGLTIQGPIAKLEGNNPHHNINATAGLYAYVHLNNQASAGNDRNAYFIQNTAGQTSNGVAAGAAYLYFGQTQNMEFVWGGNSRIQMSSAGAITAQGGFFDTSDSRLKIVVKDYEQPKGIQNVAARMYVKNSKKELGYFAQDLQEILPSAVGEGADGFLTLSYSQVHTAKIAYLEKEVAELKELIKSLIK